MSTSGSKQRQTHEQWLRQLTILPTAAGREGRVVDWVRAWVARRPNLRMRCDAAGNLIITMSPRRSGRPIFITAHLDHPAFVVRSMTGPRDVELEFRGGVHDPYFETAKIEIIDVDGAPHAATITMLNAKAKPFKRAIARLSRAAGSIQPGDVGRWKFAGNLPRITRGILHTHACDDLAAVAAALSTLDILRRRKNAPNVGVALTVAEEVGFIGAISLCKLGSVSRRARLICLENSRSFAESPIGAGPIVRVGDRLSVFDPSLTNRISALITAHARKNAGFKWQRKLMAGGACEATAFNAYGYESTCLCLPLGNYHNMADIDGVLAGKRPAKVGPEFISVDDYHGLIDMLVVCCRQMDSAKVPSIRLRLDALLERNGHVVGNGGKQLPAHP